MELPIVSDTGRSGFHLMAKPRGAICNLDCAYCYYLVKEDLYPGSTFRMSEEVLEAYICQYIESQDTDEVTFTWQGGEPLLVGIDFFGRALALQEQYRRPGQRIRNAVQTNGLLLDEAWCEFFEKNRFLIGISLDGPAQLHDAYRVDKGGRPTFEAVLSGLRLLDHKGVDYNVLTAVHAANAGHPLEVYRFLRDEAGAHFIQFIPVVERAGVAPGALSERSVSGAAYGAFLNAVFDEWVHRDVGEVFVQIFDVALAAWAGYPTGLCIFEETCGSALALEHNGDVYACDHFVDARHRRGNILRSPMRTLVESEAQRAFGASKRDALPRYCRDCEVRFVCNGGCPKNRFGVTPDGEPGLNVLCEGYRGFFNHVAPAMAWMAEALGEGRPPAGIMDVIATSHEGK